MPGQDIGWRRWSGVLAAVCLTGAVLAGPAAGQAQKGGAGGEVTDEQVVESMKKGIDALLSVKNVDNWEGSHPDAQYKGGETALVLYALLHAGDSLQDEPEYHSKLHWRGKELSPVISWLEKVTPMSTYSAGLEASALTLVPRLPGQKPWEGAQPALAACKEYLIEAMGHDGGYTYVSRLYDYQTKEPKTIAELWDEYCKAVKNGDKKQVEALKKDIDGYMKAMAGQVGGQQWAVASLGADLRLRKSASTDPNEIAMLDAELKLLDIYVTKDIPAPPPADDKAKEVAQAKKQLEEITGYGRTGQMPDPKDSKKKVPVTRDELEKMIAKQKAEIARLEEEAKTNFVPTGDLSNGQYGTLGAWALADFGIEMPNQYWERTNRFWELMQNTDGGWPYAAGRETTTSMGVAGIASLFVCEEFTDDELRLVPKPNKYIDAGIKWLTGTYNPGSESLYCMYGIERVGLSSGLKFFGTTDWYKQGAAAVIKSQQKDGSWGNNVDTSYALLFLARGRNPVVFNKLQYKGYWNARPRDDAYLTRWMSKSLEKPINWQIVNLQVSHEEWLDAPVLLITGSEDPKFSKEDLAKLRAYIHAGGMIFSTADGSRPAFTTAMKKYAAEVVDRKYEMRQLPKNHDLFSKQLGVNLPNPPPLLGMSNGVREIWIHSMQDLGADWQMRKYASKTSFEVGSAVYFYASGMGSLRSKLQPLAVNDEGGPVARTIEVARLDYAGNSDPEPGAWPRMAKLAHAKFKTQVNLSTVKFDQLGAKKYALAHLTGSTRVTFSEADAAALKAYLDGGGLLFIDAAGGNPEFATSCEELLKTVYPEAGLAPLPLDHPIVSGTMTDGMKLGEVEFRKYGNIRLGRRVTTPALEALTVDGRVRVLFSRWDVCSGFLGTNTWGIVGYAPPTAEVLGRNILLFAAQGPKAEGKAMAAPAGAPAK